MVEHVKELVGCSIAGDQLTTEERNLISVAYKNTITAKREAFRLVAAEQTRHAAAGKEHEADLLSQYKEKIASEIYDLIQDVSESIVFPYVSGSLRGSKEDVL